LVGRFSDCTRPIVCCTRTTTLVPPSIPLKNKKKNYKVIQLNRVSLTYKQMAAVNFPHFYFVKLYVKMERKVTSYIKFKKIKIANKRIANN
jgi:hypothetical protein